MSDIADKLRKAAKAKKKKQARDSNCAEDKIKQAHIVTAMAGLVTLQRKLR